MLESEVPKAKVRARWWGYKGIGVAITREVAGRRELAEANWIAPVSTRLGFCVVSLPPIRHSGDSHHRDSLLGQSRNIKAARC